MAVGSDVYRAYLLPGVPTQVLIEAALSTKRHRRLYDCLRLLPGCSRWSYFEQVATNARFQVTVLC